MNLPRKRLGVIVLTLVSSLLVIGTGATLIGFSSFTRYQEQLAGILNDSSQLPTTQPQTSLQASPGVLAAEGTQSAQINFNAFTFFNEKATFLADIDAIGRILNLGDGEIIASNVIYSLTAGSGITITGGQNPTISAVIPTYTAGTGIAVGANNTLTNTGVTSFQGSTGAITLNEGDGISIDGLEITNDDPGSAQNIFKTVAISGQTDITTDSNADTLTFAAGSGITLTTDATTDTVTITAAAASGWSDDGTLVRLTDSTDNITIGSASELAKLGVIGDTSEIQLLIRGNSTQSANIFEIENSASTNLLTVDNSGNLTIATGADLSIGSIGLNDVGASNVTSGASLIGVFDEFNNSNSTNVQDVLDDLDAAVGSGASKWTQGTGLIYVTNTTDSVTVGGTTELGKLAVDGDADQIQLLIQGNGTQTTDLAVFENSTGTDVFSVTNTGNTTLGGNLTVGSDTIADFTGNGLTTSANALTINLTSPTDALSSTITSGSGLEVLASGLTLIQGCSSGQVLKWNETNDSWECANDTGAVAAVVNIENNDVAVGSNVDTLDFSTDFSVTASPSNEANISVADDILNFTEFSDSLTLDAATTITNSLAGNFIIDLTSTGDFVVSDAGTPFFTFTDAGALTQAGSGQVTLTGNVDATSGLDVTGASLTVGGNATITTAGAGTFNSTLTADGTLDANALFTLGDGGETGAIDTSDWDISTTGVLTGISGITTDGGYTQSGSTANAFTGATTFSTDVDFTFADTENIAVTNTVTGTNALDLLATTLTNQTTAGTQRAVVITNANDAANAITESLLFIDNAETTASTVTDGIRITASGVDAGITDAIDVSDSNLTNAINVGANTIVGTTAVIDFTNFDLDASGNIVAAGTVTAATNESINGIDINAGTVSDVVNLTINSGGDLAIGAIGLNDVGTSNADSGASLIGTFDEFANSNSTNVQDVLDDLDAAIGAGASKWTDGGTITYLTATTDDLAVGASNTLTAPFSVDVSANLVRIGTGATANAQLDLYASNASTGSLIYNTSDQFSFTNGDVLVNQALTTTGTLTANGTLDSNGDLTIADTNIALDGASTTFTSTGAFTLTPGGAVLLGDGGDTLQINSSDWDISTTGDLTGIGAITADGAISFTPGSTSDITFTTDDDSNVVSTTTLTADGASIFDLNLTLGDDADADAVSALNIDVTSAATGDADNLYAIQIGNLSTLSANVSETAIRIGQDWQNLFEIEGATNDGNEFFLIAEDPAADRTYTIPYETSDAEFCLSTGNCAGVGTNGDITAVTAGSGLTGGGASGDVTVNIGAGSGITVNADDITIDLTAATDALSATTSSSSGLEVLASGLTLLQGCSDSQVLTWNESSDIWQCSDIAGVGGVGDISAVGDVSSGAAFTQTAGADGTTLYFEGSTTDANEIALTSADPGSDITVTIPNIAGTLASLAGTQTFTGAKTFDDLTISDTNIALSGATTTLTSTGAFTLTPGGAVLLGDGGDTLQINSSDWDISTTGDLTGIGSIAADGGYTQSGSSANTFTGATALTGGTTFNRTLGADSATTQSVSALTFTTPADTTGTNVNQGFSITPTIGNASGGTNTANIFNIGAVTGDAQVSLNAVNIGALTGTAAAEYALNIGTGWDSILRVGGTEVINGSGQVVTSQLSGTLLTLDGDDADTEALAQGNTLLIAGGTNGIDTDVSATDTITLNLDTTELSDTTFGSGSGFTWTFNAGATDPTLAFASDSITIGSAATLSATSVTTFNCTDCINFDDMSDTLALDTSTSIAFDAAEVLTFDAATVDSTTTGGVLDFNIDAGNAAVIGLNMDFAQSNGATAATDAIAQRIALSANDADGDVFGLQINAAATANAAAGSYESLLQLSNAENTAGAVTDALLITTTSGTAGDITDAIDASASDITNALNVGANNIIGTTAVINFDNFDVASTGAITVAASQGLDTNAAGALNLGATNATSAVIGSASLGSLTVTTNSTGDSEVVLPNDSIATAEILDNTITATDLAATLTFADGDLLDLSGINNSASTEGLRLPQNTSCSSSTAEGQICWDSDTEALYIGNSSGVTLIGGTGGGDITAVGDIASGDAFTQTAGADGTTLYFEGATSDTNEIALTSADPGSDITVTIPNIAGTLASLAGTQTFTGAKTFDDLTVADTNISFSGATTTFTTTGAFTLTPGGAVLLGDGGDTLQINSSDWDISTTGDLTGIGSIAADGGYTQSGSSANTFTGATALTGGTTFNRTLGADSATTQSVSALTFTTPADTTGTNVNQGFSITPTIGNATGGTNTANIFNIGAVTGDAQVTLNAVNIGALTGTAATEYALNIGSGWDSVLRVGGTEVINGSGQVVTSQLSGTLLTLDGDDADTEALAQGNTLLIAGGTNGIDTDVSASDTVTLNLDTTEISDATFGSGSGFTWTFNAGATDPTLAFASDSITIGSAATLSATSVTTLNCTDCINFDDMSDTLALDASTSIAFDAAEVLTFDAATVDTTTTGGVLDFNIDAGNAAVIGLNMDFAQSNGATAATDAIAQRIALSANDADGDVFGLQIVGSATANAAAGSYESLLTLTNAENTAGAVTDALLITTTSGTAGDITDAIDASASDITNALNVGANNIIGTTAVINFDNFDVASTGAITVAASQGLDTNAAGALNLGTTNATSAVIGSSSLGSLTVTTNSTGDSEVVLPNDSIATAEILDNTITATDLAATLTFADGDLLDLSGINNSATTEGLRLPQNTNCSTSTAEGQICWDSDTEALYVGNSSGVTLVGGSGGGDITAVGDVASGDAFTQTAGADGTTLYFEGATSDTNEIALTSADPGSDITVTIPNIAGTLASLAGTQTFTGAKTFDDLTIADTNIALSGATTTLTSTGAFTLTPGGAVLLGDGGDTLQINSSDWDVSTTGDLTGIGSIAADGGYTQSGSSANTFTGATALTGGTTFNRTLGADSATTQSVSSLTFTTPADTVGTNVNQGLSITPTIGNATGGTNTANIFNIGAVTGDAQVTLNAVNIGALTGTAATEYALNIGSGWDSILRVGGTEVINGSGQVVTSQLSGTLLTLDGDDADTEALAQGNTLLIAGGTNGIDTDVSATDTITLNLDTTEISDTTFGSGSGFTWTFNAGASDPTLAFASNALTIGNAATITATDVTTFNCTDCLNFDDLSDTLALDSSTSIAFDAAEVLTFDAATVDSTTTGGVLDFNIDAGNAAVIGLNMDFGQSDGATAATDAIAQRLTLSANDADGDVFGLQIVGAATANAAAGSYEAAISIDNAENTAASMTDALLITSSGASNGITDAIDVSAANINNALNAGANFITMDGLRFFEGSTGTLTFEDTSGNDIMTLVDNGTTGTVGITNNLTVTTTTQTILGDVKSTLSNNPIAIIGTYGASGGYLPGLMWSTSDNNATRPKAGIWANADGSGSDLYFGTSNVYANGIASSTHVIINQSGYLGIGTDTVDPSAPLTVGSPLQSGILTQVGAVASTTLNGALRGVNADLYTNYTATNQSATGYYTTLPSVTNTTGTVTYDGFRVVTGAALTQTTGGTTTSSGVNVTNPDITQTAGTLIANGALITTGSITTGGTQNGLNITAAGVGAGTLNGITIGSITGGSGTENALTIGSGWDKNLYFNDTTTSIQIANGGTFTFEDDAGNDLITIADNGSNGNVTITNDLSVTGTITANTNETINGIDINTGAISDVTSLSISSAASTAIALTRSSAGQWMSFNDGTDAWGLYNTAGSPEGALTANTGALSMDTTNGTLYVKTDDGDATGWVNLATGGTSPWQTTSNVTNQVTSTDNVTVGSSTNLAKLAVDGDTDEIQFLVQGNGTQTTGLMVLENSAGTDQFTVSNAGAVGIEGTISDITGATVEINDDLQVTGNDILDSGSTTRISLGATTTLTNTTTTLSGTSTITASSLATLTTAATLGMASTTTLNCADCIDFDDMKDSLSVDAATDINLGANALTIDMDSTGDFSIRDGSTDIMAFTDSGAISIVPTSGQNLTVTAAGAGAVTVTTATGSQTHTSSVVSGTTTTSGFIFDATAITTGTGMYVTTDSITQGNLMDISTTGNTLTSGNLLNISTTTTALTSGRLASLDWSPGSATTATGDLFRINIGSNGNVGNLFNVTDAASTLFSVSEVGITSAVPHSFTAAGDVAIAYDLQFTNQTASYIKSNAPLYIEAGESFENNDLTLRTFGNGKIITDGGFSIGAQETLTVNSATPSVGGASHFITANSSATNYTNFTDGVAGQLLVIEVNDANTTFNCIGSEATINCGNLDIAAAAGDILTWVYDGTIWNLINWLDEGDTQTGADLAELYVTQEEMDPGTIVMIKGEENPLEVIKATQGNTDKAIGAVSTEPHTIMGGSDTQGYTTKPVALAGRIPVKVSAENGNISPGDFITVSSQPGIGAKATEPGMAIGKALSGFSSDNTGEIGTVMMFVQNTYYSPITSELAGYNELTPDSLSSTTFPNILVSGTAEFSDVTVTGEILAGNLSITGLAAGGGADITTLTGPLRLQPDASNNVEIMGGKVIIDTEGNIYADEGTLSAKTISAEKINIKAGSNNNASIGTATINAWQTTVTINTAAVTDNSQIFVTAKSKSRQPLAVTATVVGESFTVEIPEEQEEDLTFSWWIIN